MLWYGALYLRTSTPDEVRVNVLRNKTNKSNIYVPNRPLKHDHLYESERLIFAFLGTKYPLLQVSRVKCTYYSVVPLGREREYTHYLSQWLRGVKHCVTRPETRNFGEKLQNPEQHWHAPPLCTKQPVRGGFERKRLRLKCCKRQC